MVDVAVAAPPVATDDERPPMVSALSPSSMATWEQCPRRFFYEKILRLDVEPGEAAVCGSFVHLVLEHLMGLPPASRNADAARAIAADLWPSFVSDPESRFGELGLDETATRAFKRRAWAGVVGYFAIEDPCAVDVVGTEEQVRAELDGAPVFGIVDRIDRRDDGLVITDYKSGKAPVWADEREEKLAQLRTYAALLEATGRPVRELQLLFVSPQLSAGDRARRCASAAAAAELAVAESLAMPVEAAVAAIGRIEAAQRDARQGIDDPAVARDAGDRAAGRAACELAATLAPERAGEVAGLLLDGVNARRRAFFAERALSRARPTSVSLMVTEADLEAARSQARTIWADASACYDAWEFPGRTGPLCDWCPFADRCDAFAGWHAAGRPAGESLCAG